MFRAQKTKFYTSFFKGAKNREIQKTEKMDLRHLIFWGCLKSAIFWRKTNADATTVGSGPGRLPLACMRKLTFPLWELTFRLCEIAFPLGELTFPWGELTFPLRELKFPQVMSCAKFLKLCTSKKIASDEPQKKSVPNFSNVSNQKSCFCAWKKCSAHKKTKFYTVSAR